MAYWGYYDLDVADMETKLLAWISEHSSGTELHVTGPGMSTLASSQALQQ